LRLVLLLDHIPRSHPDVDVLDLDETFCVNGCIVSDGDEGFYCFVGFEFVFADLELGDWGLEVQDWLAGEEAAGCLLVVFGERREVVRGRSCGDSGERHVWSSRFLLLFRWDGSVQWRREVAPTAVCCKKPRLDFGLGLLEVGLF
jgi:hypothetical protein